MLSCADPNELQTEIGLHGSDRSCNTDFDLYSTLTLIFTRIVTTLDPGILHRTHVPIAYYYW